MKIINDANTVKNRPQGVIYAISDTGPLISAFQSDSFNLLTQIFPMIYIPPVCAEELMKHGWEKEISLVSSQLVILKLSIDEEKHALNIAKQVACAPDTHDPIAENHLGESQAIVLASRSEHCNDILLLDELAARTVADRMNLKFSGFPGVLLLSVQTEIISAEELKMRLETCHKKGTHYSASFIRQVYNMAKEKRRFK